MSAFRSLIQQTMMSFNRRRPAIVTVALAAVCLAERSARGQQTDWIQFFDASCRIVAAPSVLTDDQEKDIAFDDLNGDEKTDLVIVRKLPFSSPGGKPNLLFMNEGGLMVDRTSELAPGFLDPTDDRDVVIVDINQELNSELNMKDVITAGTFSEPPRVYINLGCCNTACSPASPCPAGSKIPCAAGATWCGLKFDPMVNGIPRIPAFTPPPSFCAVAAGDVSGDGCPDLYFADYANNLEDRLLVNRKTGGVCEGIFDDRTNELICNFTPPRQSCFNVSVFGTAAQIADLNGDSCNDIIKAQKGKVGVAYQSIDALGNCLSRFENTLDLATGDPYMFSAEDVNLDGYTDVYLIRDTEDTYRINQGNGGLSAEMLVSNSPKTAGRGGNVRLVDLDGDFRGTRDVVVSDVDVDSPGCGGQLALLQTVVDPMNVLNVTITDPMGEANRVWNTSGTYDTGVFDVDGNDIPDLWSGTCSGNRLFIQGVASPDCNTNGVPDDCDLAAGSASDCNGNMTPDLCDISSGASFDCNADLIPDDCQTNVLNALILRDPVGSDPGSSDTGGSLWRLANNFAKFTFACDLSPTPAAGQVRIREMLDGGTYGSDLSASLTFSVVNNANGKPRILRMDETGGVLAHRKWFAVDNNGWSGKAAFAVQYLVNVGDANNDALVTGADVSLINANISPLPQPDSRCDVDGNGRVLGLDYSLANANIDPIAVPKPSGH